MRPIFCFIMALIAALSASSTSAQSPQKWVTSWTGSVQDPYPIGNPSAQPDLRFAFPSPQTDARDQSFRLIVRPDLWGRQVRLRFSNALGTRPVTFDGIHVRLPRTAAALVPGGNQPVSFAGRSATAVAPGSSVWSDPVTLPFEERYERFVAGLSLPRALAPHLAKADGDIDPGSGAGGVPIDGGGRR
jgi:hypothetical protein